MKKGDLMPVTEFCKHYKVQLSFIRSLKEYELIEITTIRKKEFIHQSHLVHLEKLVRLHYDLNVNLEGIDVINHLLQQIEVMRRELIRFRNKVEQ